VTVIDYGCTNGSKKVFPHLHNKKYNSQFLAVKSIMCGIRGQMGSGGARIQNSLIDSVGDGHYSLD